MEHNNSGLDDAIIECLHLSDNTLREKLRQMLLSKGYRLTDRELRKQVEHLVTEAQHCIASSSKGYSLVTNHDQLERAKKYLNSKAYALIDRAKCLENNYSLGKLNQQLQTSMI